MTTQDIFKLQYAVNYDEMDPFKISAQKAAQTTDNNADRFGFQFLPASRGESASVMEIFGHLFAFVVEGLGTFNLIADLVRLATGEDFYNVVARSAISAYVSDANSLGADVFWIGDIIDSGNSNWFSDPRRNEAFCEAFAQECNKLGAVWGPGESAGLRDTLFPASASINGACFGLIKDRRAFPLQYTIEPGDKIILIPSSGMHINYLTACRDLAFRLPNGYQTRINNGRGQTYYEALMTPATMYQVALRDLFEKGFFPKYMVNISGHGWRKIMRAQAEVGYVLTDIPPVPQICHFVAEEGNLSYEEAYEFMNMGAGFALIVRSEDADHMVKILRRHHKGTMVAGYVDEGPKRVEIQPLKVNYGKERLKVR